MTREEMSVYLISKFEGYKPKSYQDQVKVWTIGYGSTILPDGSSVQEGDTCDEDQAKEYLEYHLEKRVYPTLENLNVNFPDKVYASLASFSYNLGSGIVKKESFAAIFNNEDWGTFDEESYTGTGLAGKMIKYIIAGGVPNKGLKNRRIAEVKYMLEME